MKNVISTDKAPAAIGPYSQAIEVNGTVYTSGTVSYTHLWQSVQNSYPTVFIQQ